MPAVIRATVRTKQERLTPEKTRIRNKAKLRPIDLVDPRNTELRGTLQRAEFAMMAGTDLVVEEGDDELPTGSASDSD
ncbi:hypothetical protein LTR28_013744 [Elasticomyces elasticus]|nr:hypothetical protein LTR28_013744 [Elasticomyces elasticus]